MEASHDQGETPDEAVNSSARQEAEQKENRMFRKSESIAALTAALAKAQEEIKNPALDSKNPHFGNRYASLGAHLESIRVPFARNGLALTQHLGMPEGVSGFGVTTVISHSSGEWISSTVSMPMPDRAKAQDLGSMTTYLRRYAIAAVAMLTGEEDDDAERDRNARSAPRIDAKPKPSIPTNPSAGDAKPAVKSDASVFDPRPIGKASAAPASSMKPRWPSEGKDVVEIKKCVEREGGFGVLCAHPTFGNAWLFAKKSHMAIISDGLRLEIGWRQSDSGDFAEVVSSAEAPRVREMIANKEIPF
jgi:hypothetical protein